MKDDLREKPIIVVVKKGGGHGHHGGAWKVAFADFMTAMMAMFLVLWIVGQSTDVKSAIAGHFQDPLGRADQFGSSIIPGSGAARPPLAMPMSVTEIIDPRVDRLGRMEAKLQLMIDDQFKDLQGQIEIDIVEEGLRITLIEDTEGVFFESGSAVPHPAGRQVLESLGKELAILPNHVIIEGHTDSKGFGSGSRYTNWELSSDRANSARRLLVDGGLQEFQIDAVRGFADRQLRNVGDPTAPENRRITVTMLLGPQLPGLEQLAAALDSTIGEGTVGDSAAADSVATRGSGGGR